MDGVWRLKRPHRYVHAANGYDRPSRALREYTSGTYYRYCSVVGGSRLCRLNGATALCSAGEITWHDWNYLYSSSNPIPSSAGPLNSAGIFELAHTGTIGSPPLSVLALREHEQGNLLAFFFFVPPGGLRIVDLIRLCCLPLLVVLVVLLQLLLLLLLLLLLAAASCCRCWLLLRCCCCRCGRGHRWCLRHAMNYQVTNRRAATHLCA